MKAADLVVSAHKHSSRHREEVLSSEIAGCFYCLETFAPADIVDWIDENDSCALCPKCGIDSVIGSASGYPIDRAFLQKMKLHWF